MTTLSNEAPERQDIEALLPWHAAGTLNRRDSVRVEQALAGDCELARRFDVVREELHETIHLNESLGAPSSRAMERLFAAIDAEPDAPRRGSFDWASRASSFLGSFAPRTLAWSAGAAAVVVLAQAAVITTVVVKDRAPGHQQLASAPPSSDITGSIAVMRFTPEATAADITKFLSAHNAVVVDGPQRGGLFSVRLATSPLPQPALARLIQEMQSQSKIVDFIATRE